MKKKNSFGDIIGAIAGGFAAIIKGLIRLLLKVLVTFGLWLPALYALLGVILYYGADFNPFGFDVYSVIYLSGGVACVVCAIIISVRNVFVLPVKSAVNRRRDRLNDEWAEEKFAEEEQAERLKKEKEERRFSPPEGDYPVFDEKEQEKPREKEEKIEEPEYLVDLDEEDESEAERRKAGELLFDWVPVKKEFKAKPKMESTPKKEIPEVYFSKLNPSILVHEYKDRFELFQMTGDKTVYIGVEYK